MGTGGFLSGVKRPGRESDHSPPTSTMVKKTWVYISTPPYTFMAKCLVKQRNNFTFYILVSNPRYDRSNVTHSPSSFNPSIGEGDEQISSHPTPGRKFRQPLGSRPVSLRAFDIVRWSEFKAAVTWLLEAEVRDKYPKSWQLIYTRTEFYTK
jgi:hypothetical protein